MFSLVFTDFPLFVSVFWTSYTLNMDLRLSTQIHYTFFGLRKKNMYSCCMKIGQASNSKSSPHSGLRRSHGVFNMLGWGILMVIGVMVARYCRHRDPLWFYLHVGIQSTGLLMGITGVLCGFLLDNRLQVDVSTHKGIGIFIFVLGCIQVKTKDKI